VGGAQLIKKVIATLLALGGVLAANPATAQDTYDIKVVNASEINMVAKDSRLPIIIRNDYDSQARVLVHVSANNGKVSFPEATYAVIPGFSTYTAKVPVTAISSGEVELQVWLTSTTGVRLTENVTLKMNINADLEFVLLGSFFIAVAVLGAAGVIRTLRKKKVAA
jgi:hypothetical protein